MERHSENVFVQDDNQTAGTEDAVAWDQDVIWRRCGYHKSKKCDWTIFDYNFSGGWCAVPEALKTSAPVKYGRHHIWGAVDPFNVCHWIGACLILCALTIQVLGFDIVCWEESLFLRQ